MSRQDILISQIEVIIIHIVNIILLWKTKNALLKKMKKKKKDIKTKEFLKIY